MKQDFKFKIYYNNEGSNFQTLMEKFFTDYILNTLRCDNCNKEVFGLYF